jgi:hypothetical protein
VGICTSPSTGGDLGTDMDSIEVNAYEHERKGDGCRE